MKHLVRNTLLNILNIYPSLLSLPFSIAYLGLCFYILCNCTVLSLHGKLYNMLQNLHLPTKLKTVASHSVARRKIIHVDVDTIKIAHSIGHMKKTNNSCTPS
mmetsp:Transcript_14223/g.30386  ORF Transcript_14223/g.30386 Transcript_14223/m.30386 type:complete len:102 (-) Transcript_14223:561-866(-)